MHSAVSGMDMDKTSLGVRAIYCTMYFYRCLISQWQLILSYAIVDTVDLQLHLQGTSMGAN